MEPVSMFWVDFSLLQESEWNQIYMSGRFFIFGKNRPCFLGQVFVSRFFCFQFRLYLETRSMLRVDFKHLLEASGTRSI